MPWHLLGVAAEGQILKIEGTNVWSQEWRVHDEEFAVVKDPRYHKDLRVQIYSINAGDKNVRFAAGEVSNGVWAFYRPTQLFGRPDGRK